MYHFKKNFTVTIDVSDSIISLHTGKAYKSITGYFNTNILISDGDEPQAMLVNSLNKEPSTLVLFKKGETIYLVYITSYHYPNSKEVINILNIPGRR